MSYAPIPIFFLIFWVHTFLSDYHFLINQHEFCKANHEEEEDINESSDSSTNHYKVIVKKDTNTINCNISQFSCDNITENQRVKEFTFEEDDLLLDLFINSSVPNWKEIATNFEDRSDIDCYNRINTLNSNFCYGPWNQNEDELLVDLFNKFGKNLIFLSSKLRFRSPLHIKKRYIFLELNNDKFSHSSPAVLYKDLSQKYPIIAAKIANDNISVPDPDLSFDYEYFYNSTEAQSSVVSL